MFDFLIIDISFIIQPQFIKKPDLSEKKSIFLHILYKDFLKCSFLLVHNVH